MIAYDGSQPPAEVRSARPARSVAAAFSSDEIDTHMSSSVPSTLPGKALR